jgi:hypothetical protein
MKKVFSVLALALLAGCAGKADKAQGCAGKFLDAFLKNDFEGATQLCSESFRPEFSRTIEDFRNLPEQVSEMVQEQCSALEYEILSVARINKSDTFIVEYNIVRAKPDTAAFRQQELVGSVLRIVDGKVDALNR